MIESANDIIDDILEKKIYKEICEKFNKLYSITNYAVLCDGKLLCFTGGDITDAWDIEKFLRSKYTNHEFSISDEFMSFENR
jgi:hypothetical protein